MDTKKILVVDFDLEFQKFLSQFLRNEGFSVSTASDGFAGMDKIKAERPDLVITEAMLPKLHGFELCSRVAHNALHKIPVIIVTGVYRDTVYKTEALRTFGAAAYFEKPLDTDELLASIRKILDLPVPEGRKEEVLDEAILESVVSQIQAPAAAVSAAPGKEPGQKPARDDIDIMLQSALAEFGLDTPKKKAPAPVPAVPVSPKPGPAPGFEPKPEVRREPRPEPVALVIPPSPPTAREEKPAETRSGIVEIIAPFGEYTEKKKKAFSPKIFGAAAGVVILSSAMIFVLKPRKAQQIEELMAPPAVEEAVIKPDPVPSADATAEEEVRKMLASAKPKAAARKKVQAPVGDAAPLIPEAAPQLDLKVQDQAGGPADEPPAPVEPAVQEAAVPAESPAPKTKAGELVPLESVDAPPLVIRRTSPVYPATAISLKAETSVTVNALISETGDVLQTAVVGPAKGYLGFDTAAEAAVRKWKFRPARKDGVNVRVWKALTIEFILKKQGSTP